MVDENRFQAALSHAPVVLFAQDAALRYTWIHNPSDPSQADFIGRTDADLFPAAEAALLTRIKAEVLRTGKRTRSEPDSCSWRRRVTPSSSCTSNVTAPCARLAAKIAEAALVVSVRIRPQIFPHTTYAGRIAILFE